jgi:hypothetical protein
MKKLFICLLLLFTTFSLYAQTLNAPTVFPQPRKPSASVYVLPVTGTGATPEDNALFYNKIVSEITEQSFILAKTLPDSEFYYIGALSASPDASESGGKQYIFHLTLLDTRTNTIQSEGDVVYEDAGGITNAFSTLVYTLLLTIPETAGKNNWRNKWVFANVSAFWTPRAYAADSAAMHVVNFGGGIYGEVQFLDFLAAQIGVEFTTDMIKVSAKDEETPSNYLLEIPVMVKHVIKPGEYFLLEPYTGIHLNIPFTRDTVPPAISWLIGFEYGVKLGPGVFYIDPRFSIDLGKSVMNPESDYKGLEFQRYIIHIGAGYKLGFFTRR